MRRCADCSRPARVRAVRSLALVSRVMAGTSGQRERIRVLWVAKGLGPGGMERLLVHHARFGDRQRFDYRVAYLVESRNSLVPELEALDVPAERLEGSLATAPTLVRSLRRVVRRHAIDVVHVHSPAVAAVARPALRSMRARPRLVYTEHSTWAMYRTPTLLANALTYPLDDHQFAVSDDAMASVPRPLRSGMEVLTHGVDVDGLQAMASSSRRSVRHELGIDDDQLVVVSVANLREEKGIDVLLDAARAFTSEHPEVVVLSVGQGPMEDAMKARHRELGLGDRFRFLGYRDDVPRVLGASDVFCLSSHSEGLPVALMEATVMGLPVVATAVGGVAADVEHGVDGLLAPPGDPAALAAAIGSVAGDAELRSRLGAARARRAVDFDGRVAVRRQEEVYSALSGVSVDDRPGTPA